MQNLPRIPLSSLQNIASRKNAHPKKSSDVLAKDHNYEIKIKSPFYKRHDFEKGICNCPYHRMKKYQEQKKNLRHPTSPVKKMMLQKYRQKLAKSGIIDKSLPNEKLIPVQRYSHVINHKVQKTIPPCTNRVDKTNFLDHINYKYEEILKQRMFSLKNDEKVRMLIKFIKMQRIKNKQYLSRSKDYIYSYLLSIVNKIGYNDLKQMKTDDNAKITKITILINSKEKKGIDFVQDVQQAMRDMQKFLIISAKLQNNQKYDLKINTKENQENNGDSKEDGQQWLDDVQKLQQISHNLDIENYNNKQHQTNEKNNRILESHLVTPDNRSQQKMKKITIPSSIQTSDKNIPIRKRTDVHKKTLKSWTQSNSLLKIDSNCQNGILSRQNIKQKGQKQRGYQLTLNRIKNTQNIDSQDKNSAKQCEQLEVMMRKGKQSKKNSRKNTQFQKSASLPKQENQSMLKKSRRQLNNLKSTKNIWAEKSKKQENRRQKSKSRIQDRKKKESNPFDLLKFDDYFKPGDIYRAKAIILDTSMLPQPKVDKIFPLLIKKIAENQNLFSRFIKDFSKIFNQSQIQQLQNKYDDWKYHQNIEKLTRQLDFCLRALGMVQLPQEFIQNQECEFKKGKKIQKKYFQIQKIQTDKKFYSNINDLVILQGEPDFQDHKQPDNLDQCELGEIIQQQIDSKNNRKKTNCKQKRKKQQQFSEFKMQSKNTVMSEEQHKKILKFMKKKYPKVFEEVCMNVKVDIV